MSISAVMIDMRNRTLSFCVDGKSQGIAFRNLPTGIPLSAAVSLYKRGDKVQIASAFVDANVAASTRSTPHWQKAASGVKIDGARITKLQRSWDNGTAIVKGGVTISSKARLKCSFRILHGTQITLGVCTSSFNVRRDGYVNKTACGWGYYQGDGKIGHNCSANKGYGKVFAAGDIVEGE